MTSLYLGLALTLALTLNAPFAALRALGSLVAAVALGFMAWSIVLANQDSTFAAAPAGSMTPLALNIQAGLITLGAALLLWSIPRQFRRPVDELPLRSTPQAYGAITRGLHWGSAALVIAAFTIGQFVSILAPQNSLRAEFLDAHMALGGAVFLATLARMFERLLRPGPPSPTKVHAAHFLLYAAMTALCVTGLAMAPAPIDLYGLKLPNLPADPLAARLHRGALPVVLALLFAAHLGGAVKSIRRMAR
ncbi:cytochrome b/b6 domain-containing protein [Sandarakinorhabdus sp.]|uniref:cytochrome b/b6 domain-containing protein n=1 Tax=Sandarakinorhabdus sp. TaxID=1916663 RepID=UPI00333F243A